MSKMSPAPLACIVGMVFLLFPSVMLGDFLLIEDFNDNVADDFTPLDTGWEVVDGVYRCDAVDFGGFFLSKAGDFSWGNYSIDCDIKVEGSINQVLAFRVQDRHNFYDINLRGAPYNEVILTKVVNGIDTWYRIEELENTIGVWHHLRVTAKNNLIDVEIDGQYMFQQTDGLNPYLSGGIALVGFTGGNIGWQTALFDDVIVEDLTVVSTDQSTLENIKVLFR